MNEGIATVRNIQSRLDAIRHHVESDSLPTIPEFLKSLKLGKQLAAVQVKKLANLHLRKHSCQWPARRRLMSLIQNTTLEAAPNSHHSRRLIYHCNRMLDDGEHRAEKQKEHRLRSVLRGSCLHWHQRAKDLLMDLLSPFVENRVGTTYTRVVSITGCQGWSLKLIPNSCVSLTLMRGCSSFPDVPRAHFTVHGWLFDLRPTSLRKNEEFVESAILQPAKERLERIKPPDPFINLSTYSPTEDSIALLNKGLTFVPSYSNQTGFQVEAAQSANKIAWNGYWQDHEPKKLPDSTVARLETWPIQKDPSGASAPQPKAGSGHASLCSATERLLQVKNVVVNPRPEKNFKQEALEEITALATSEDHVFVEADKGSGLILLNRTDYSDKMNQDILNDRSTYEPLEENPLEDVILGYRGLLGNLKREGLMIEEEAELITAKDPILPRMFGLPKLHKPGNPMRPVVSCVRSPLAKSGKLIDAVVKPAVASGWQYLRDTTATLHYIMAREQELLNEGFSHDQMYLVSFDVESFYPRVPHECAMTAFERARDKMEICEEQFQSIKRILQFHLDNAVFSFQKKYYKQKTGLPIGSAIGGPMACLALALEEDNLLERLRAENPTLATIFEAYRRYLDDSLILFAARTLEEACQAARSLHGHLNNMHPGFRFTETGAVK